MVISESYCAAAEALGDPCELRILPGTGHFEHIDASTEAWRIGRDWLDGKLSSIAARSEATKRSSAPAPSSAAWSAAEPTTIPSASSAAAAACAGVEMPNPA